jgi:hypothetical protein
MVHAVVPILYPSFTVYCGSACCPPCQPGLIDRVAMLHVDSRRPALCCLWNRQPSANAFIDRRPADLRATSTRVSQLMVACTLYARSALNQSLRTRKTFNGVDDEGRPSRALWHALGCPAGSCAGPCGPAQGSVDPAALQYCGSRGRWEVNNKTKNSVGAKLHAAVARTLPRAPPRVVSSLLRARREGPRQVPDERPTGAGTPRPGSDTSSPASGRSTRSRTLRRQA